MSNKYKKRRLQLTFTYASAKAACKRSDKRMRAAKSILSAELRDCPGNIDLAIGCVGNTQSGCDCGYYHFFNTFVLTTAADPGQVRHVISESSLISVNFESQGRRLALKPTKATALFRLPLLS